MMSYVDFMHLNMIFKNVVVLDSCDHIDIKDLSDCCSYIDEKTNNMRTIIPEEQNQIWMKDALEGKVGSVHLIFN